MSEHTISWNDFENILICVGTVLSVDDLPDARVPAYILTVDFGEYGIKRSSTQITERYSKEELIGKQIVGVINFPPKQVGSIVSEFLTTGFYSDNGVVLAVPDKKVRNGNRLA
jgi:tRNA-binding protein